ncbi:MAG: DUF4340 domain-containing protein [Cyanobacteria bacterium P01_A01_bin.135]
MAIARSTIGFVAIAALLAIAALALVRRPEEAASQSLLSVTEADIDAVTIQRPEQTLTFERQADGWQMRQPQVTPAESGAVVFLLNLLASETGEKQLAIAPDEAGEFGFDSPLAEIEVTADGEVRSLVLGDYDFSNQFIYALMDPGPSPEAAEESLPVYLVSPNFEAAVSRPLEEWKADADGAVPLPTEELTPINPVP